MIIKIDFNSDEALYMQLRNQIIIGIANSELRDGDNLPSVRNLAMDIGINMHTVNKAYNILRQEGYIKLDRRYGAVVCIDIDKCQAELDMIRNLRVILARAACKNISKEEVHEAVDRIFDEFEGM
ncbi:MAG: GntR family transcriptional regulator [Lachnospiraceae bacterium]|jgi:DNA-binding transcriptional regulator YhcF (GntR family)|nr:GntR family transcriptional regulator [Lachnospiraceae bacterium]